ncbi:MAG: ABC transporter ATP-binding protein [Mesorhizobium sp.]|uniref:ABC transporter ATP-binding protein n=1 Tax=Mesorhizobium sp. TaxID=1871066 RepID=UPI000FEAA415|nr:oligopeptide/dipeptide ABC transporter ATP-binding protein [Mesorhizobium sp.]RWI50267.1 MAG: ABC transporter ATP-binding protein [Mesorhizobium sp.]
MTAEMTERPIVSVASLSKHFPVRGGILSRRVFKAVDEVSFEIRKGETLGLVGESGSGKSTLGRVMIGLAAKTSGSIVIDGHSVGDLKGRGRRSLWRRAQMVFQDPYSSLNPKMNIRDTLAEPLANFGIARGPDADALIRKILDECGLGARAMRSYPKEFSGGQRQRIGIARALILQPKVIIADEPVSALDVSIQAQIINLFQDLQQALGLTYLFIAHDLAVVRQIADRVAVMYRGRIVELASAHDLFARPRHPYTKLLIRSIPIPDPTAEAARIAGAPVGETPAAGETTRGCRFSARCPKARFPICGEQVPPLAQQASGHLAACHFPETHE